jgi:hypothetical protein
VAIFAHGCERDGWRSSGGRSERAELRRLIARTCVKCEMTPLRVTCEDTSVADELDRQKCGLEARSSGVVENMNNVLEESGLVDISVVPSARL